MIKTITSFLLLLLTCCSSPSTPSSHTLRLNICKRPSTMDPRSSGDFVSATLHFLLFEGLMRLNADGTTTPAQAAKVDISNNGLTYTFHLRAAHWSDGSIVTAQDFEYAWKKVLSPEFAAPNAHLLYVIKNGEKVKKGELDSHALGLYTLDDLTLVVELERPTPYFLNLVCFCTFFPVKEKVELESPQWMHGVFPEFVCNGPFCLNERRYEEKIVLGKNESYWDAATIDLSQIHMSMIADENTALSLFEKGELDMIGRTISPIPAEALDRYRHSEALKSHSYPATAAICFNIHRFPFHNVHVRRAFSYAIHRSQIVEHLAGGHQGIALNINAFQEGHFFVDFDLKSAKEELEIGLKELGITLAEFPKITLEYAGSATSQRLSQILQEQWQHGLGIHVELSSCEPKVFLDHLSSRTYDFAQTVWMAQYNDPMSILDRFKFRDNLKNYPGWEHPAYVHLLNQSAYEETEQTRDQLLQKAEALLLEEMPLTPIYHWKSCFMIQHHLIYEEVTPTGAFDYARIKVKQ